MDVTLTWSELTTAAMIGVRRQVQNLATGKKHRYGANEDETWSINIDGCCGEMVVAKALGMYWTGNLGDWKADDVGGLQVRTTYYHTGDLCLHRDDQDDKVFVLVTGRAPHYRVPGWIYAWRGKNEQYWSDKLDKQGKPLNRPAFWVPQSVLLPIEQLRR